MSENIIFVDIDGPLLPGKYHYFGQNRKTGKENHPYFDPWAVRAFNMWARYSNAKIVFSTHWAFHYNEHELKEIMRHNGLGFNYHDDCITPKKISSNKVDEVYWWLVKHPECTNFIVVEDDHTCRWLDDHIKDLPVKGKWIDVNYDNGISMKNFIDGCEQFEIDHDVLMFEEFGVKILSKEEKAKRDALIGALI